jgi:hypothetical protein
MLSSNISITISSSTFDDFYLASACADISNPFSSLDLSGSKHRHRDQLSTTIKTYRWTTTCIRALDHPSRSERDWAPCLASIATRESTVWRRRDQPLLLLAPPPPLPLFPPAAADAPRTSLTSADPVSTQVLSHSQVSCFRTSSQSMFTWYSKVGRIFTIYYKWTLLLKVL